jgi:hypothetical protein
MCVVETYIRKILCKKYHSKCRSRLPSLLFHLKSAVLQLMNKFCTRYLLEKKQEGTYVLSEETCRKYI